MKQPLAYMVRELDKLYDKSFDESDIQGINNHCEFISSFIHAAGYTEDEMLNITLGFEPDISRMN